MATYTSTMRLPWQKITTSGSVESSLSTDTVRTTQNLSAPLSPAGGVVCRYALSDAATETATETVPVKPFVIRLAKNAVSLPIVPGSVSFTWAGNRYVDRMGSIFRNPDPVTGLGVLCGTVNYLTSEVSLDVYDGGTNSITVHSLAGRLGSQYVTEITFRTPGAPLRPGSLTIAGVSMYGERISAVAGFNGELDNGLIRGGVDHETGVVTLGFGEMVTAAGNELEPWYNADLVDGLLVWKPTPVYADSLTYACVIYSYIPLDANLIGINPVRLPSDGRVPVFKPGNVAVVHNTQVAQLPNPLAAGQVISLPRAGVNHVELYDSEELYVPSTKFAWDEELQTLTMADPLDLTEFAQPLFAMHRVEDMCLVSDVQINGQITMAIGVTRDYPIEDTYISSALLFGDLQSRYYGLFDQTTWTGAWSNDLIGNQANATYNEINYPVLVSNQGAVTERWALVFTSAEQFNVIGEKYGIVGIGYVTNDCQPINPATQQPFFFVDYRGWGAGWASGNAVRFNTEGAVADLWVARTTLQGPVTEPNDQFTIQIRGDAE